MFIKFKLRHDECVEHRSLKHDEELTVQVYFSPQVCFPDLSNHLTGFLQRLWTRLKKTPREMSSELKQTRENASTARWEPVTCSMSAASLRRWAISSDSVNRSLRRPDLYSWPTSSLWRLSFTWLTRKCITAFGTLREEREETDQTDG